MKLSHKLDGMSDISKVLRRMKKPRLYVALYALDGALSNYI